MSGRPSKEVPRWIARSVRTPDRGSGVAHRRVRQRRLTTVRCMLLLGVLAGLFGMHVLTAQSATGGHGALPRVVEWGHPGHGSPGGGHPGHSASGPPAMATAAPAAHPVAAPGDLSGAEIATVGLATSATAAQDPGGMPVGHGGPGGCILFVVIGGAAALLGVLTRRTRAEAAATGRTAARASWGRWLRRGPPGLNRPRVALCVIRI